MLHLNGYVVLRIASPVAILLPRASAIMTMIKFVAQLYAVQAAAGFIVGFTIPWLQFFDIM
jgi:hypothetical protein